MVRDPVCGIELKDEKNAAGKSTYKSKTYYFCSLGCRNKFDSEPGKYVGKESDEHTEGSKEP